MPNNGAEADEVKMRSFDGRRIYAFQDPWVCKENINLFSNQRKGGPFEMQFLLISEYVKQKPFPVNYFRADIFWIKRKKTVRGQVPDGMLI